MKIMDNPPLLSIIIPLYNAEKYIIETIESIYASTFVDYEVIIVNDGSTDKGAEICATKAKGNTRILDKPNGGVSSARNLGLQSAHGRYITFVDADDLIAPDYLENIAKPIIEDDSVDFVQAGCRNYYSDGSISIEQIYKDEKAINKKNLFEKTRGLTFSKLFQVEVIRKHRIRFDEKIKIGEDMVFTMQYLPFVKNGVFLSETGYLYRRHNSSATKSTAPDYRREIYEYTQTARVFRATADAMGIDWQTCDFRKNQCAKQMLQTVLGIYRAKVPLKKRISFLKDSFNEQDLLDLAEYKGTNAKRLLAWILSHKYYHLFDIVAYTMLKIN